MTALRPIIAALLLLAAPWPANAHDAFGDLGPFYANLLHPLADPLQAALIIGAAALLAGKPLGVVRVALPLFMAAAIASHTARLLDLTAADSSILAAAAAVAIGLAAALPERRMRLWAVLVLVGMAGIAVGLAPDQPPPGRSSIQPLLGTVIGILVLTALPWIMLDSAARRFTRVVPAVAGSWVAAIGILAAAFSL
jgi:hypothetical protein